MSLPNSLKAYTDVQRMFEKAEQGTKGARFKLSTREECINLRTRLHYYRTLDREANAKTYPADHHLHGQSPFDEFVVQIVPDQDAGHWIYIVRRGANILAEELLDSDDFLLDVAPTDTEGVEIHQLEDHSNG